MSKETRRVAVIGVVLAIVFALLAAGPGSHAGSAATTSSSAPATTATFTGAMSTLTPASAGPLFGAARGSQAAVGHRALIPPPGRHAGTSTAGSRSSLPTAASTAVASSSLTLPSNFSGLNSADQFDAYGGAGVGPPSPGFVLEPPDQGLCSGTFEGNHVVFEIINDVIGAYTTAGFRTNVANLNNFFAESPTLNVSDPRCLYDATTSTFFFTSVIYTNDLFTDNHTDVLVLNGTNGHEKVYHIDTRLSADSAGGCPCFGDQPKLGLDKNNVYVVVDQFNSPNGTDETGDALFAISKSQLVAMTTANVARFENLSLDGIGVTALQPAITYGTSNVEYLLNSFPYADAAQTQPNTASHLIGLWALTHTGNVTTGTAPTLHATLLHSKQYGAPVPAQTTNGLSLATLSNDSRMQQVELMNGELWGALNSGVAVGNDPVTRDGLAWFEISPSVNGSGTPSGTFTGQGDVAVAGKYLVYPAIVATSGGAVGIGFTMTSTTQNPTTAFVLRPSGSSSFGSIQPTSTGPAPDIGFTCLPPVAGTFQQCRWGDYSWATLDPDGAHLWMASELTTNDVATQVLPPISGLPAFFSTNWGTRVWEVPTS